MAPIIATLEGLGELMDTLAYKAYWQDVTSEVPPENRPDWQPGAKARFEVTKEGVFIIIINNVKIGYNYDVAALELSAYENGIFPIIICVCGDIGCSGAYVEVSQNDDKIVWKRFWHGQCCGEPGPEDELKSLKVTENIFIKPPLRFQRQNYEAIINNFLQELQKHKHSHTYQEYQKDLEQYKAGNRDRY